MALRRRHPDPTEAPSPAADDGAPPAVRRGPGPVVRSVLLAVGLVGAFFVGLAAVMLLGVGEEDQLADDADVVEAPGLEDGAAEDPPDSLPDEPLTAFGDPDGIVDVDEVLTGPAVVNFWATWCPPCVEEMPAFQEVHEQLGHRVDFLGINVQDAPANAEAFVEELDITYDLAVDADASYYQAAGGIGMPTTLLVEPDGTIAARHVGLLDADELRELLAEHLGVRP